MSTDSIAVVQRYYEAFNARRWDEYAELFAPQVEKLAPGMPGPETLDPEGMVGFDRNFVEAISDARIEASITIGSGDHVMSENRFVGTHDGTFHTPIGDAPATGNPVNTPYVGTFVVRDGRIVSQHLYFDMAEVAAIVGLVQQPSAG